MSMKRTVGTMACAAAVLAYVLPGTVVRADAYACADVVRVVSLDAIPDGYDASDGGVQYVVAGSVAGTGGLDGIPDGYDAGDGGVEYVVVPHVSGRG